MVQVGEVGEIFFSGSMGSKNSQTEIDSVRMATVALAERGTQFTVLAVFAIEVHYRDGLRIVFYNTCITARHKIERQKVDG